jgi:hypothetical protein
MHSASPLDAGGAGPAAVARSPAVLGRRGPNSAGTFSQLCLAVDAGCRTGWPAAGAALRVRPCGGAEATHESTLAV